MGDARLTATHVEPTEYLIEVPHSPEECVAAEQTSDDGREGCYRTYRGCGAGTHTTWIIAQLANENDAWSLVPRLLRDTARVVPLERCEPSERRPL